MAYIKEIPTGLLVLGDGTVFYGRGHGAETVKGGEIVFNTAMTGYQEIMTDPSYSGQIVLFTFPHIGIVGCNDLDSETPFEHPIAACGMIMREPPTEPSNWRASESLNDWLIRHQIPAISGLDTRALTHYIRNNGVPLGIIAVNKNGTFDLAELQKRAKQVRDLNGLDLAKEVTVDGTIHQWQDGLWQSVNNQYRNLAQGELGEKRVVCLDYGTKSNIFRILRDKGCALTVLPRKRQF